MNALWNETRQTMSFRVPGGITVSLMIFALLGMVFAGCQEEQPAEKTDSNQQVPSTEAQTGDRDEDELVLRMQTWEGYAPVEQIEKFEQYVEATYGRQLRIEVTFTQGGDNDFYDPIRKRAVDVVTLTHHLFKDERFNYISKGMLLPLDWNSVPNSRTLAPELRDVEFLSDNGNQYGVPICRGRYNLAFNKGLLAEPPDSWNALWDPAYHGLYSIAANEYIYNINITALAMGYPIDSINDFDALNNLEFKKKLRQLTENAHSFWVGQDKPENLSGMSLGAVWGDSFTELARQGEMWATVVPREGTPFWVDNYAITWALAEKPFLRKLAEEWIDIILGQEFQVGHIVRELNQIPVVGNIEAALTDEEKARLHIGIYSPESERRIPQQTVSKRNRNGLDLIWQEAMAGIKVQ